MMDQTSINIEELMNHYNVMGLSVSLINGGEISSVENYGLIKAGTYQKVDHSTIFNACSISKFLTSMVVLILTEQGILDLDEDVNKKLTAWRVPHPDLSKEKFITLRNLLSHQSGIIDPEGSFMELIPGKGFPSMAEILSGATPYCKESIKMKYEPESSFHYSDGGYCVIQQVIEDVTLKPFEEIADELVFQPLHMKQSTFLHHISEEVPRNFSAGHNKNGGAVNGDYPIYPYPAASGLWTAASDLSLLVLEVMDALHNKSKLGISARMMQELISPQGCRPWTGLGVFLDGSGREVEISSLGWGLGFQSLVAACPYTGKGLAVMTNTDSGIHQLEGIIGAIYNSYNLKLC
ncbi:serine hydrolase domain-containing protein [Peribacillus sp. SCS-37]|uniref:serine hydrolase domain-containing protein n=1 Tax=Paraperibacillus esterisolvens TaxID=3115296 RepID=UPI00390624D3